jgi:hypothetical protein
MMYEEYVSVHGYGLGPLHFVVIAVLLVIPFWKLFSKAGHSGWLSLLMLLPLVNVLALYYLAFSDWPALRNRLAPTV